MMYRKEGVISLATILALFAGLAWVLSVVFKVSFLPVFVLVVVLFVGVSAAIVLCIKLLERRNKQ